MDPSFEFEKRRNVPVKYNRELWSKTVEAMKQVETIRQRRQNLHIMQRLRKGRELEQEIDVKEVQRDLPLIRSPAIGLKKRMEQEEANEEHEQMEASSDEEVEELEVN